MSLERSTKKKRPFKWSSCLHAQDMVKERRQEEEWSKSQQHCRHSMDSSLAQTCTPLGPANFEEKAVPFSFVLRHGHNANWRTPRGIQRVRSYPGDDWQMDFTHALNAWVQGPPGLGTKGLLEPVREGLHTVILATPTAVTVPEFEAWIHHSRVKPWSQQEGTKIPL
ncbi:uncharacterized protein LOC113912558 [Zalophus californianus]|uniref:Uncharacterized protein LOC113912558 n=1 Tax=Zalophus californianus TaxID=9704 RepID=A0A6J2BI74_ZALCA|nr:uncharacterized protein LOC113912558 [Zalophus californianus]